MKKYERKNWTIICSRRTKILISNFIKFFHNKIKEIKSKNNISNEIDEKIKDYDEIYQVNILDYNYPPINNDNLNFKYHFLPRISEIFLKKLKEK